MCIISIKQSALPALDMGGLYCPNESGCLTCVPEWLLRWGAAWEMEAAPHPPLDVRIVSQHDGEARPTTLTPEPSRWCLWTATPSPSAWPI